MTRRLKAYQALGMRKEALLGENSLVVCDQEATLKIVSSSTATCMQPRPVTCTEVIPMYCPLHRCDPSACA